MPAPMASSSSSHPGSTGSPPRQGCSTQRAPFCPLRRRLRAFLRGPLSQRLRALLRGPLSRRLRAFLRGPPAAQSSNAGNASSSMTWQHSWPLALRYWVLPAPTRQKLHRDKQPHAALALNITQQTPAALRQRSPSTLASLPLPRPRPTT